MTASLLAFVVMACGGDPAPSSAAPSGPTATALRDGIQVSLTLDRATLPAVDRTLAVVTVENTGSARRLWQGGGCNFLASITIVTSALVAPPLGLSWNGIAGRFKDLLMPRPEPSKDGSFTDERFANAGRVGCPADLGVNTLEPGQRLEMHAIWSGEINGVVALPGPARVTASFPYLGPTAGPSAAANPQPIEAALDVVVADNGVRLLSPGQAIDAALANPAFSGWLAAAGEMANWDGVDLESSGRAFVVILSVHAVDGRAIVDRVSGAVTFEQRPRS